MTEVILVKSCGWKNQEIILCIRVEGTEKVWAGREKLRSGGEKYDLAELSNITSFNLSMSG